MLLNYCNYKMYHFSMIVYTYIKYIIIIYHQKRKNYNINHV